MKNMFDIEKATIFAGLLICIIFIHTIAGCSSENNPPIPEFDEDRCYQLLVAQCDFGPRPPGSQAHKQLRDWMVTFLDTFADTVYLQHFSEFGYKGEILPMANVIARFNIKDDSRILLCAHWDTRPRADRDPDSTDRDKPILGGNDGASGVAVLLHLAELLYKFPPPIGVDIVLFDGEDYGVEGDLSKYLMGSKYFARNCGSYRPKFAILLDMIGDKDLRISKEYYSAMKFAPELTETVWARAKRLNLPAFVDTIERAVIDDHHSLAKIGIKIIDIIDFDYPYWHTLEDTPDKCSPESLGQIGKLMVDIIYNPPKL